MRVDAVHLHRLALPLVTPFRTSFGTQTARHTVLVHVETDVGDGWGEGVAMPWPGYSAETTDGALAVVRDHLVPRVVAAGDLDGPDAVERALAGVVGNRQARAGLATALLDAWLRAHEVSLATWLGADVDRVPAGVSVGLHDDVEDLLRAVGGYLEQGYHRIKLKIEPGRDVGPVAAVRRTFGDGVALQVDANSAYHPADVRALRALDEHDLLLVEQPFGEEALLAHADLRRVLRTPVCLDESAVSAQVVADAVRLGAADLVNLKPGRLGGLLETRRVHDLCVAHGLGVWTGGMVETGVGRATCAAVAAMPGNVLPGDTSGSSRFFARDVVAEPLELDADGHLPVPHGPGLGVEVDPDALVSFAHAPVTTVRADDVVPSSW